MELKTKSIKELQEIMQRDYNIALPESEAENFGVSLLRLSRLASVALARADEKDSSIQARDKQSLESKTNE